MEQIEFQLFELSAEDQEILKLNGLSIIKKNSLLGGDPIWIVAGIITPSIIKAIKEIIIAKNKKIIEYRIGTTYIRGENLSEKELELIVKRCK